MQHSERLEIDPLIFMQIDSENDFNFVCPSVLFSCVYSTCRIFRDIFMKFDIMTNLQYNIQLIIFLLFFIATKCKKNNSLYPTVVVVQRSIKLRRTYVTFRLT